MTFFRKYCLICGRICKTILCESCKNKIKPLSENKKRCIKCSKPLFDYEDAICDNCIKRDFYFERNVSLYPYQEGIKELVRLFKFEFVKTAGIEISNIIKDEILKFISSNNYDFLVPVPVSQKSLRERGFNPVTFILDRIKVSYKNILTRKSQIKRQSELSVEERVRYIKDQFYVLDRDLISEKNVLIVDDIFTSGNTLNEISRILFECGARKVNALTFFRD